MIKLFEQFNEYNQVKDWLDKMGIVDYIINDDLTVDVNNFVRISDKGLNEIPVQFNRVEGSFICSENNLTSLKGCPKYVGDDLICKNNKIESLEYSPEYVNNTVYMTDNNLTTLKYSPKYIGGSLVLSHNPIKCLSNNTKHLGNRLMLIGTNNLPNVVKNFYNYDDIKILLKHQDEYGIWNSDDSFNPERYKFFYQDYVSGLLDN